MSFAFFCNIMRRGKLAMCCHFLASKFSSLTENEFGRGLVIDKGAIDRKMGPLPSVTIDHHIKCYFFPFSLDSVEYN